MDVQQYIESGILEDYALGLASPQDSQAVECLSKIYPEIEEALWNSQQGLEFYATALSQKPSKQLKEKILTEIKALEQQEVKQTIQSKIQANKPEATQNISALWKWGWGLALFSMIGLGVVLSMFLSQKTFLKQENKELKQEKQSLQDSVNSLKNTEQLLQKTNQQLAFLQAPEVHKILLGTTEQSPTPKASATIHWNSKDQSTYLGSNSLPETTDQDYQLWAIVENQPVDLGLLSLGSNHSPALMNMKNIANPTAFAITLEPKGGSKSPTMDQMCLIGYV